VFSKHIKLHPLRAATTKASLNKLTTDYFPHVIKPSCILSDHGTQFTSPMWKKKLSELYVTIRYSPIRHSESNPVECVMREIGKYCKIYCYTTQKKWPELIPKIESSLNTTISGSTGFTPVELMFNDIRPDIFSKILNKTKVQQPNNEELQDKITPAYLTLKK
jgi:transposase InsO family protein